VADWAHAPFFSVLVRLSYILLVLYAGLLRATCGDKIYAMTDCCITELSHTAEIGLLIQADTPEMLFACAAAGMFGLLRVEPDQTQPKRQHTIQLQSVDPESLLVDWLNELIYLYDTTGAVYTDCTITQWQDTQLTAEINGWPTAEPPAVHIKATTYHDLFVRADDQGWSAQVFFDI